MLALVYSAIVCMVYVYQGADASHCSKSLPQGVIVDCTTALMECPLYDSRGPNGVEIGLIQDSSPNSKSCYRTCFDTDGNCRATIDENLMDVSIETVRGSSALALEIETALRIINSNNFNNEKSKYLKSTITRYNIRCDGRKQIQYSFRDHSLERSTQCNNMPNTCIDFLRIDFPTYNTDQVTCGSMNDIDPLIGLDGMSEIDVEFVANRATQRPGFRMYVYCREPSFDAHFRDQNGAPRGRRNIEFCTSPNGFGLRDEPFDPPPAERIQDVLDRDVNALFGILEVGETLTYSNNTVTLSNGTSFPNINCLTVENRIQTKTISGSSTGYYGGFAQVVVSQELQKVVVVQFGVRPIFQPTEEEAIFIGLLESGIREVLIGEDETQFLEFEDEIDVFPRFDIQVPRSRRGVDRSFLDNIALEFGNACNGALRSAACHYQDLILNLNCLEGSEFEEELI